MATMKKSKCCAGAAGATIPGTSAFRSASGTSESVGAAVSGFVAFHFYEGIESHQDRNALEYQRPKSGEILPGNIPVEQCPYPELWDSSTSPPEKKEDHAHH